MWSVADQLHRSLGSISANLAEGYSRSKGLDRARFFEFSLGSAHESRDWYYKSRHALSAEVINHRIDLVTQIIAMLTPMISHQRTHAIREEQAEYNAQSSASSQLGNSFPLTYFLSPLSSFFITHFLLSTHQTYGVSHDFSQSKHQAARIIFSLNSLADGRHIQTLVEPDALTDESPVRQVFNSSWTDASPCIFIKVLSKANLSMAYLRSATTP